MISLKTGPGVFSTTGNYPFDRLAKRKTIDLEGAVHVPSRAKCMLLVQNKLQSVDET